MMAPCQLCVILLFIAPLASCSSSENDLITQYPLQIRSERDLPNCATANTVCSILQKRYWIPSILNRYCRCPEGVDCPADWTGPDDLTVSNVTSLVRVIKGPAYSLPLNNRAQMKFCASMKGIETCAPNQSAVNIRINGSSQAQTTSQFPSTRVLCKCPSNHTWQQSSVTGDENTSPTTTTSSYTCKPLKRCRLRASCGAITTDTFSVYPYCLCRRGSVCTIENRTQTHVEELHYSGPAYLGVCKP
ncbi:U-scoloptoxin(11)-Sm2a-like isoform X1 [Daphnia pulicaria]|uniref:U-scoloptoxin(11)-Sm2a-like isoform X1 n=1 Tax=Daphnia pulicaria TaxID=35523 RepID=UPI001EEA66F6|nr:U-scoloptoxin(11)-Sm2a-like isoform X1 [Daphnia pulicaria]